MRKRATKRRQSGQFNADAYEEDKVRSLFPGTSWSPDDKEPMRDQSYTKNVKPRSKNQAELMEAIDSHNLVMALGPAVRACVWVSRPSAPGHWGTSRMR